MIVTATTSTTDQLQGSLRRMDPTRDLDAIADLIEEAFAGEIDERGRAAIHQMRWMARLTPLVWWWSQADPAFQDAFNGFVWEEPGSHTGRQIVGNVSLNRTPGNPQRRIICNVVVHQAYQGQGIGRLLIQAAIAEAQASGGEGLVLQVHQGNSHALRLYTRLGFREVAGEADLELPAVRATTPEDAPGYHFRAWRLKQGQAAYELAQLATPPPLHWIKPIRRDDYQLGWWTRLGRQVAEQVKGQRAYRLVVMKEQQLVGMVVVTAALRHGSHRLELLVHPKHRGQVEQGLLSRALYMLSALPSPKPVLTTILTDHGAALNALHDSGFIEQRTLLTLRKDFNRKG